MREAKISDYWERLKKFKKYRNKIKRIKIPDSERYSRCDVVTGSAITTICGRNGLGKTTLLKLFYKAISKDQDFFIPNTTDAELENILIEIERDGKIFEISGGDDKKLPDAEYFDCSYLVHKILEEIKLSPSKNGWGNGSNLVEVSGEDFEIIKLMTGKKYSKFSFYEVEGIIEDSVFPNFEVVLDGRTYSNEFMGQGEHKLLVMWWRFYTAKENSFILLEEPETYICPSSQKKMMDMIAYYSSVKLINLVITSHSEHILEKMNIESINILKRKGRDKYTLIPASDNTRYLVALDLNVEYKKILLVEDGFAKRFLETVLKLYDEGLYRTSLIHVLNGESNIQMVTKHYQGNNYYDFIAVYDADQRGVNEKFPTYIKKVFLPSVLNKAPEFDVISYIEEMPEDYQNLINVDSEIFLEIMEDLVADHHDWFSKMAHRLDKNIEFLIDEGISLWVMKHREECERFLFELTNVGRKFDVTVSSNNGMRQALTMTGICYKLGRNSNYNDDVSRKFDGLLSYEDKETVINI